MDLHNRFKVNFNKTGDLITFMQNNYAHIDFGFLVNAQYSFRRGYEEEEDNTLVFVLEMQRTSSSVESEKYGEVHIIASNPHFKKNISVPLVASQDQQGLNEHASIVMKMMLSMDSNQVEAEDQLSIVSTISHTDTSLCEAKPGKPADVKLILPSWVEFKQSDTCTTNYTANQECDVIFSDCGRTSFRFTNGICFSDFIGLNFTLSINRDNMPLGPGVVKSTIVTSIHCHETLSNQSESVVCGPYNRIFVNISSYCSTLLSMQDCNVFASTALDDNHLPVNVIHDDETIWSPALRARNVWKDYLVFYFQGNIKISSLQIKGPNLPLKVTIAKRGLMQTWLTVLNKVEVPIDGIITLQDAIFVEALQLIMEEYEGKVELSYVELRGCQSTGSNTTSFCRASGMETRVSTDKTKYRHVSYDPFHRILYLCDLNPNKFIMFCYSNKKGTKTFKRMPLYVSNIIGYSSKSRMMYLQVKESENTVCPRTIFKFA